MIAVDEVSFTYPGVTAPTLQKLTFSIRAGEVYGLLGPSGAGKSTTQRILMGLLRDFTGQAQIFGQPVHSMGRALYGRIGVSFELPTVYLRLTALENLKLFAALYERPCRDPVEVLRLVDLEDAAQQRAETFSKGMKMRLNLARALLHDPELLFLDEPTTGQDPARARTTRALILRLKAEGRTVFLTTHNMAEAQEVCDRIGFLAHGRIVVSGAPEALRRQYGEAVLEVGASSPDGVETRRFPMAAIGGNEEFLTFLREREIVSIHTLEASLDDVFIRATRGPGRGESA